MVVSGFSTQNDSRDSCAVNVPTTTPDAFVTVVVVVQVAPVQVDAVPVDPPTGTAIEPPAPSLTVLAGALAAPAGEVAAVVPA